jgi:hypothetical protein
MAVAHTFEHISGGERFGKKLYAGSPSVLEPGILVKLTSGSLLEVATASDVPFGFAYGLRYSVYRPTTKVFALGEEMAVVKGTGMALASSDFFTSGTLPTAGATLYTAAAGLMTTSGTYKVGYCVRVEVRIDPSGGTGTNQSVALISFHLPGLAVT